MEVCIRRRPSVKVKKRRSVDLQVGGRDGEMGERGHER